MRSTVNILVLGAGGREHALAESFFRFGHNVFCHPGNPGMLAFCHPLTDPQIPLSDFSALASAAHVKKIDLTVVGPELPLSLGIADYFMKESLPLFGPTKIATQLQNSRVWSKQFMLSHQIPSAQFFICKDAASAREAAQLLFVSGKKAAIKLSDKSVVFCGSAEEVNHAIAESDKEIIVEERLEGVEVSLPALSDGQQMVPLLPVYDHKHLNNGGLGPNTGGVGAVAPAAFVTKPMLLEIERSIIEPTLKGLQAEGIDYRGMLYFGLILTKDGPKVLEYNCRFGDPETQAILPLLDCDPVELMLACLAGKLDRKDVRFNALSSCCVILSSNGYPDSFQTGFEIEGLEKLLDSKNLHIFHAGTALDAKGKLITSGGRVLGLTGIGATLQEAIDTAYLGIEQVRFQGAHYRTDIGDVEKSLI